MFAVPRTIGGVGADDDPNVDQVVSRGPRRPHREDRATEFVVLLIDEVSRSIRPFRAITSLPFFLTGSNARPFSFFARDRLRIETMGSDNRARTFQQQEGCSPRRRAAHEGSGPRTRSLPMCPPLRLPLTSAREDTTRQRAKPIEPGGEEIVGRARPATRKVMPLDGHPGALPRMSR